MVPKKSNKIIQIVSEEKDIPQHKVDAVVTAFYKEIRKTLSGLNEIKVNMPGLGVFQLRFSMVQQNIKSAEKALSNMPEDIRTFEDHYKKEFLRKKLEDYYRINVKINEYLELKNKWKNDKAQGNLEKQKTNSRGNNKLNSKG